MSLQYIDKGRTHPATTVASLFVFAVRQSEPDKKNNSHRNKSL